MKTIMHVIMLLATLFLAACSGKKQNESSVQRQAESYAVLTLEPKTVTTHLEFPATIEGQQVIEIRPMISGYIKTIHVNEGDYVKNGQLLFTISNPQYEQEVITAKASIESAEAAVASSEMDLKKVKPLVEKEIISDYQLEAAELNLQSAQATLAQAKATLANAETNLSYTVIRSPQEGLIGTIPYKIGALVSSSSSEALTSLSNIDNVYAYFSWNEKDLLDYLSKSSGTTMKEKIGHFPEATLVLANGQEYPITGEIQMASGLISTETGSATFKGIFANPDGIIRSGASATIKIPQELSNVFVIPQSATYELQDKRFVYTVDKDNKVSSVAFTYTSSDDGKYYYATEGLNAGERIVTEGVVSLEDGKTIVPKKPGLASL